jgi:type I restriction enzyme S subunit
MTSLPKYDRYKDSGVEWLGEVPEHWHVRRNLGVFDERKECNQPEEELLSVTVSRGIIRQSEITAKKDSSNDDKSKYKVVRVGDLAYNKMRAWQGALGISAFNGIVSPAYVVLTPRNQRLSKYFHYLYRTPQFITEANRLSYGLCDDMNSLRYEHFKTSYTPLPPDEEIDSIVAFLDQKTAEIDALIAKKQRQIELLDEQKAILINRAVTQGLNPNAKLKPSGIEWIGDIPATWEILRVKHQAVYFTSGSRGWGDFYSDEGDLFLQSGDLTNNCTISLTNAKRVKLPRKAEGLRTRLQTNDTVVCITGANTGRVANVGEISETIYVNQHLCLVRPSKVIDHRYLSLALSGSAGRTHFSLCQYGLKEGLSLDDVKNCAFPVPPLSEQGEILGFIDRISSAIEASKDSVSRQIQSLKSLRSTLIAHAVTGRIAIAPVNP